MFTLTIKKNGVITNGPSPFDTEAEAQAHFEKHKGMGTYGQNSYTYESLAAPEIPATTEERELFDETGASFDPPQFQTVETPAVPAVYETITVPAEYEYFIEDLTANAEQERINAEALAYLTSSDWFVTRYIETGLAIPEDVLTKRKAAREAVVK